MSKRPFNPWSAAWWWDRQGDSIHTSVTINLFFSVLMVASFWHFSQDWIWTTAFALIAVPIYLIIDWTVAAVLTIKRHFRGPLHLPSDAVAGRLLWENDAVFGWFSNGRLVITDEVIAFVPGAYRSTGKPGDWETEVIIPLREFAQARRRWVWFIFPTGLTIVRTSGDEERFIVSRPAAVIREIEKARDAWRVAAAAQPRVSAQPRVCSE